MRRLLLLSFLVCALPSFARVVRLDIASRGDGPYPGYEQIKGRVTFAVDPANPHNRIIADLDEAGPGQVTFTSDVLILRPKCGGNDTLFVDVPNRGGIGAFSDPNADDYLFRHGYTMAWVAWQFDVREDDPSLLRFDAPVARGVRGTVHSEFTVDTAKSDYPIGHFIEAAWGKEKLDRLGGVEYRVADRADQRNVLTERDAVTAPRRVIPRSRWRFTDDRTIHLDGNFVPGKIYELVYVAQNPAVAGTGLAAIRDFVSWSKHDPSSIIPAKYAYAMGISQTGRLLRHFVYDGFNADEEGRPVFDAMLAYVAGGGRGSFNQRFAQPSRPVDVFPFTDVPATDPVTKRREGLLDRAVADHVVPKIFYMNTAYEYWSRAGSLIHTTPDGRADVELPPTSRLYVLPGHSHFPGPLPLEKTNGGLNLQNPLNYWTVTHALLDALDAWVKKGTEPPPSLYPRIGDGTLVRASELKRPGFPTWSYEPLREDGSTTYTTLVMQIGADGNELAGVRLPLLSAPLGMHTGWNPRDPATGFPTDRTPFTGSFIPFAKPPYASRDEYLGRVTSQALKLIEERYVAADELPFVLRDAVKFWDWATTHP